MKHWSRLLFICLFTLLQSVAPLAHAHINGDHGNGSLHAVELERPLAEGPELAEPGFSIPDSPAIGMPHQLSRDNTPILLDTLAQLALPPLALMQTLPAQGWLASARYSHTSLRYETPLSHAPPGLA